MHDTEPKDDTATAPGAEHIRTYDRKNGMNTVEDQPYYSISPWCYGYPRAHGRFRQLATTRGVIRWEAELRLDPSGPWLPFAIHKETAIGPFPLPKTSATRADAVAAVEAAIALVTHRRPEGDQPWHYVDRTGEVIK